jgi:hypothetical protein
MSRRGPAPPAGDQAPGACLCGAVRFEVQMPTLFCAHCHCSLCRRSHGAGHVTWFGVPREQLHVVQGSDSLVHHRSSQHGTRSFCGRCGSSLFFASQREPGRVDVALASMLDPIDRAPQLHVFFDDRARWTQAEDGLPRLGGASGFEPIDAREAGDPGDGEA